MSSKYVGQTVLLISINKREIITGYIMAGFLILPLGIDRSFVQNSYMKTSAEKTFQ